MRLVSIKKIYKTSYNRKNSPEMEVAAPKKTHMAFKANMANIICSVQYAQIIEANNHGSFLEKIVVSS